MARPAPTHPTDAELKILNVLWRRGSGTLREIHEALQPRHKTALTTTLKTLQIMTHKGLVLRDTTASPSRYTPARPEAKTQANLTKDLIQKAFEGSASLLLVRLCENGGLSDRELQDIRKLIDGIRKQKRGDK